MASSSPRTPAPQRGLLPLALFILLSSSPLLSPRVTSLADKLSIDFALIQKVAHQREEGQGTEKGVPLLDFPPPSTHLISSPPIIQSGPWLEKLVTALPSLWYSFQLQTPHTHTRRKGIAGLLTTSLFLQDDMIDSTKTFVKAAKVLAENGATKVYIIVTHSLLSQEGFVALDECADIHEVPLLPTTLVLTRQASTNPISLFSLHTADPDHKHGLCAA